MNVQKPEKPKGLRKRIIIYILILIVCVVSVGIAIYQFFLNEKLGVIVGITHSENEEIDELKSKFNGIFNNAINIEQKKDNDKYTNIISTEYTRQNKSANSYDLNVNIPSININSELAQKYNNEIKRTFKEPAEFILQTQNRNIAYTVNYIANIKDNILSISILSTFKEGNSAQRTMVATYNYDLTNNTEVTLDNLIQKYNMEQNVIEERIKTEIKKSKEQADKLRELGYEIYSRDINNNMYKLQNTTEYFVYNSHLYLIYAYGNNNNTSEIDIIII